MIVINIALIILGILYGVGSVTNFKEWYYRHDYLAIMLSVFTSILLVVAGVLNILYWWKIYNGVFTTNKDLIALEVTSIVNNNRLLVYTAKKTIRYSWRYKNWKSRCTDWRYLNVIELTAKHRVQGDGNALVKWVSPTNSPLYL